MLNELDPIIDQWYAHLDKGQRYFVTAINEDENTIDIQYFDSTLEEISLDEWHELPIELSVEPENWAGALDITEQDDFGTEITDTSKDDWAEPGKDI